MLSQENRKEVQSLIAEDKIEEALTLLLEVLEDEASRNALAIHSGTLKRTKKAYQHSQINWVKMSDERARISSLVLDIISGHPLGIYSDYGGLYSIGYIFFRRFSRNDISLRRIAYILKKAR